MKILKDETYNSLQDEIKELKAELQEEKDFSEKQSNIIADVKKEYADFVLNAKMTFSIKRVVVGRKASGKTTFIKEILHKIPNYFVIDLNNEYLEVPKEKKFVPAEKLSFDELEEQIKQVISDNSDKTLIVEEVYMSSTFTQWFMLNSRDKNFILVSQCKRRIEPFIDSIDFIYDFGTADNFRINVEENKIMQFNKKRSDLVLNKRNSFKTTSKTLAVFGMFTLFALGLVAIAGNDQS